MRKVAFLMVLLLVSSIACIQVEQKITINKDGSALLDVHYSTDTLYIKMMEMMKQMAEASGAEMEENKGEDWFPFSDEDVKKTYDNEDFELNSFDSYYKDGKKHIDLEVKVKNIKDFMETEQFGEDAVLSKNEEGNYVINLGEPFGEMGEEKREVDEQTRQMLKGLYVYLEFNTPTKIIKTTAQEQEEKLARWVFDIEQDDSFIETPPNIYLEFDGKGLDFLD